ncbi:MAG: SAM-dependent methyltransferase, partial [Planctomycetes bacterium]|nr:SAM-dependent methyltransferase [Planctomycetota bacterium]
ADLVGPEGRVFSIDVQVIAIERTRSLLGPNRQNHVDLRLSDHANLASIVPCDHHGRIAAIMFNLGFLPGSDRLVTTQANSTIQCLQSALQMVKPNGIVTVIAYRGHSGGKEEYRSIQQFLQNQTSFGFQIETIHCNRHTDSTPVLLVAIKYRESFSGQKTHYS